MTIRKTSYSIDNAGCDSALIKGLNLAVLADFHDGDYEAVLSVVREDPPDAIMIPGDVVLGYFPEGNDMVIDRCTNILPFLRGCAEIAPTYMSVGNHECLLCDEEYEILRSTGTNLLDNEWTELKLNDKAAAADVSGKPAGSEVPGSRILIGGLTSAHTISYRRFRDEVNRKRSEEYRSGSVRYPYRPRPRDIGKYPTESEWLDDFAAQEGYKILLCHHPEYWCMREPMIRDRRIDLVLAGHAHGGQWQILGRGIFAPYQGILPKYTSGVHFGPYGRMIISKGLSNPYKVIPRWGNPCEVVFILYNQE